MRPELSFDFRNPDYGPILQARVERLSAIREDPELLAALKVHYRENPWDFVTDWGMTWVPMPHDNGPTLRPFILFPKQIEWLKWVHDLWQNEKRGLVEKSRESGVSWLALAYAVTMCLFNDNFTVGFGSALERLVDNKGDMDSLLEKARMFLRYLPTEFTGGWNEADPACSKSMLLKFPHTGSTIKGDMGDNIGRGGRSNIYFVDEFAQIAHADSVDASLSQSTKTQIDISTVRGSGNAFAVKRHAGRVSVFTFSWVDDPRKDRAWYDEQVATLDPVIVAQEIDINYNASVEGIVIPSEWVNAAIDADKVLGINVTGPKRAAMDVADEGKDKNALAYCRGSKLIKVEDWSGKGSDILYSVQQAFRLCDEWGVESFRFDSDGMGVGVRGDARALNEGRAANGVHEISVQPWRGSGPVSRPDKPVPSATPTERRDRTNKDYFANAKAQGWWDLRVRFQRVYRAVEAHKKGEEYPYDPDDMIFLDGSMPKIGQLVQELSRPVRKETLGGKIIVDKGTPSPNLADAVMYCLAPRQGGSYDLAKALDG